MWSAIIWLADGWVLLICTLGHRCSRLHSYLQSKRLFKFIVNVFSYLNEDKKAFRDTSERPLQHPSIWVGGLVYVFNWQLSSQGSLRYNVNKFVLVTVACQQLTDFVFGDLLFLVALKIKDPDLLASKAWTWKIDKSCKNMKNHIFHISTNLDR